MIKVTYLLKKKVSFLDFFPKKNIHIIKNVSLLDCFPKKNIHFTKKIHKKRTNRKHDFFMECI